MLAPGPDVLGQLNVHFPIAIIQGVLRKFPLGLHSVIGCKHRIYRREIPVSIWKSGDHSHYCSIIYAGVDYTIVETSLDETLFLSSFI